MARLRERVAAVAGVSLYLRPTQDLTIDAETGPASWGRLLGALKMAILAGAGAEAIARQAVAETGDAGSPASAYARSLALVCLGEEPDVGAMVAAGGAFERTGRALRALAFCSRDTG